MDIKTCAKHLLCFNKDWKIGAKEVSFEKDEVIIQEGIRNSFIYKIKAGRDQYFDVSQRIRICSHFSLKESSKY